MNDKAKVGIAAALMTAFGIFVVVDQQNLQKAVSTSLEGSSPQVLQTDLPGSQGSNLKGAPGESDRTRAQAGAAPGPQGPRAATGASKDPAATSKNEKAGAAPALPGQDAGAAQGPPRGDKSPLLQVLPDGRKAYTVQQGDTLFGISAKIYSNPNYYEKLYEANQDKIDDPNTVRIGLKLIVPDLPSSSGPTAPAVLAAEPSAAPAGAGPSPGPNPTVCQVTDGDSLWRIAERYAIERKLSITDMMKQIVQANPGKLKDLGSLLQTGWRLVIPEQPEAPKKPE